MALSKVITSDRGIITTYHRIVRITITDQIAVDIAHYTDTEYRDREKANQAAITARDALYVTLVAATDKTEIAEISAQTNAWALPYPAGDYAAFTSSVVFSLDKEAELTFSVLYGLIKALPDYAGAEDI